MHFEILDEKRIKIFKELNELSFINSFALGGGTALSLQLGLRKSFDFAFFSNWHFDPNQLLCELKKKFANRLEVTNEEINISTLDIYIDNVQVSFFEYRYKNLEAMININDLKNIKLLSIVDIATMKSVALVQRGTKKDFFDLYFILHLNLFDINTLINDLKNKYEQDNLIMNFIYSLSYFDDAEDCILPETFVDYNWEDIKKYFIELQNVLFKLY